MCKEKVKSLNRVWLFVTPWTVAYQAPSSMGFSRQEYWSGLPFPSPRQPKDLNPGLLHCRQTLYPLSHKGSFYVWEDVNGWAHWIHSFHMHLSYLAPHPASWLITSLIPHSPFTGGSGWCCGWLPLVIPCIPPSS